MGSLRNILATLALGSRRSDLGRARRDRKRGSGGGCRMHAATVGRRRAERIEGKTRHARRVWFRFDLEVGVVCTPQCLDMPLILPVIGYTISVDLKSSCLGALNCRYLVGGTRMLHPFVCCPFICRLSEVLLNPAYICTYIFIFRFCYSYAV